MSEDIGAIMEAAVAGGINESAKQKAQEYATRELAGETIQVNPSMRKLIEDAKVQMRADAVIGYNFPDSGKEYDPVEAGYISSLSKILDNPELNTLMQTQVGREQVRAQMQGVINEIKKQGMDTGFVQKFLESRQFNFTS